MGKPMDKRTTLMKMGLLADKIGSVLERICGGFCVFCLMAMTLTALLGVFFRYVMQSPFMWTEEAARYLMVWLGFTAISIALRRDSHIKVEFLPGIAPPKIARAMGYMVDGCIAFFMILLLWQGWLMTANNIMNAATLPFSMSWILAAVPLAALLTLIQLFLKTVQKIARSVSPPRSSKNN